jgi:flagellar hook-length control protein FliK
LPHTSNTVPTRIAVSETNIEMLFQVVAPQPKRAPDRESDCEPGGDFHSQLSLFAPSPTFEAYRPSDSSAESSYAAGSDGERHDHPMRASDHEQETTAGRADDADDLSNESTGTAEKSPKPPGESQTLSTDSGPISAESEDEAETNDAQSADGSSSDEDARETENPQSAVATAIDVHLSTKECDERHGQSAGDPDTSLGAKNALRTSLGQTSEAATMNADSAGPTETAVESEAATSADEKTLVFDKATAAIKDQTDLTQEHIRPALESGKKAATTIETSDIKQRSTHASQETTPDPTAGEQRGTIDVPSELKVETASTHFDKEAQSLETGGTNSQANESERTASRSDRSNKLDSQASKTINDAPQIANVTSVAAASLGPPQPAVSAVIGGLGPDRVAEVTTNASASSAESVLGNPQRRAFGITSVSARDGAEKVVGPRVDTERFVSRVTRAFHFAQERGGTLQLRLNPPELGALRLELTVREGVLNASLEAETPAARQLLLDNLPTLRERLADQNVRVERFDVDLRRDEQNSERNAFQHGQQQPPQEHGGRTEVERATRKRAPARPAPLAVDGPMPTVTSSAGINLVI